jgi:non-specific serine/threonine protein kinase
LALLMPLQRAAAECPLVAELVSSGDIYQPLGWTAEEAYALLSELDQLEAAGLVVRTPDWWKHGAHPRPAVSITIGDEPPAGLGIEALLDFQVSVTLGGERLDAAELAELLQATAGLALIRGRWVEVDAEQLSGVLDQWLDISAMAEEGGISFSQAMRLLAGSDPDLGLEGEWRETAAWSTVAPGRWLEERLDALRAPVVLDAIEKNAGLDAQLRPYQKLGVQWLWTLFGLELGGCLADDMGLGKTIQVIALLSMLHEREATSGVDLLVVPASLIANWTEELAHFAPHLKPLIAHASALSARQLKALTTAEVEAADLVITTYGTVTRTPWIAERSWRSVVLDEAQAIKNPSAKQTRSIKKLHARWRLCLTGTPVENRLGDLWSLFDFLNPGLLGSAKAFGSFCRQSARSTAEGRDGYAPLRKLVQPYILRRLKTDKRVISDLPDKTEVSAHCLLTKPQAALYKDSVRELEEALRQAEDSEAIRRRGIVLAFLTRFKQICNHPDLWLGTRGFDPASSGKFQRLAELVDPIAARQEKLLVFTQFKSITRALGDFLETIFGCPGLVLHGGTRVKRRGEMVHEFQDADGPPFMVLSLKAGGTGLNLTAANHVVHFDRWWNPAVEDQATDRAFRIGQKRNVMVHKFGCQGTIEERIDQLIASMKELASSVLAGGAEASLTELSNDELLAMVRLDLGSAVSS